MPDFLTVLIAASIPATAALLVQIYESKNSRRQSYDEKRLLALLDVHQKVEQAVGRWFHWSAISLNNEPIHKCDAALNDAEEATHNAWYSTRAFEMFFPTLTKESRLMREEITRCKDEALRQVRTFGAFDKVPFSTGKLIDLDVVTLMGRKILGYPAE